jgi:hypothetical protein|tara:strand:- start:7452 stop:8987 length:1536 start_codon:yes stop_codon:yes gene_type:complete
MRDLSSKHSDYATFLPAISGFMTELLGRCNSVEGYIPDGRIPKGFEHGFEGMNFLDKEKGYYYYNKGLYSAGHAYLDMDKSKVMEHIIQGRDRSNTTIVGDSGGFQIGKGVIKFDWENFFEKPGDVGYKGDADRVRGKILNWLEHTADWSMTFDVPSWACKPGFKEKTGLQNFDECLKCTTYNLDWFMDHRQGKTKFLNVLQGTYWDDAEEWYQKVKDYPTEGWGMGGNNIRDMYMALKRIIILRDDEKLQDRDWIHFLGTSKLEWAVMLTSVQRQLREHVNPNITVSFDCASPYISSANGLVYTRNKITSGQMSYIMEKCFDNKANSHFSPGNLSQNPFPWESEIGSRLLTGDVNWYAPGMLNKIHKEGKTSWDSFTYGMLMSHNVYMHIRAVQEANSLATIEFENYKLDWRNWQKKGKKLNQESLYTPRNLLMFNTFVEELFQSDNPHQLLDDAHDFLNDVSNNKHKDHDTAFQSSAASMFFDEEVEQKIEGEFDIIQEQALNNLVDNL